MSVNPGQEDNVASSGRLLHVAAPHDSQDALTFVFQTRKQQRMKVKNHLRPKEMRPTSRTRLSTQVLNISSTLSRKYTLCFVFWPPRYINAYTVYIHVYILAQLIVYLHDLWCLFLPVCCSDGQMCRRCQQEKWTWGSCKHKQARKKNKDFQRETFEKLMHCNYKWTALL